MIEIHLYMYCATIAKHRDPCAPVMFKIVLALSLVDRRSPHLTRRGGHVLQHRLPVASLRDSLGLESTQRSVHCCEVSRVVLSRAVSLLTTSIESAARSVAGRTY